MIWLNVEETTRDRGSSVRKLSEGSKSMPCVRGVYIGRTERPSHTGKLLEHNKCGEGSQIYSHCRVSSDKVWLKLWRHSGKTNSQDL